MRTKVYDIQLDDVERRIVVQALSDLKMKQINQGKSYDFIDKIILKCCEEQQSKGSRKFSYEER